MSLYWKQSLIIGGIYWLFSLVLIWQGSWGALITDCVLSLLLLLFLLPLNILVPIKRIDNMMIRHPITATMLASVGWIPYFTAVMIIIASVFAIVEMEYLEKVMTIVVGVEILRKFLTVVIVFAVLVAVLVYGKSIAGQLDDKYNLIAVKKLPTVDLLKSKPVKMDTEKEVQQNRKVSTKSVKKVVADKAAVKAVSKAKAKSAAKQVSKKSKVSKVAASKAVNKKTTKNNVVKKAASKKAGAKKKA